MPAEDPPGETEKLVRFAEVDNADIYSDEEDDDAGEEHVNAFKFSFTSILMLITLNLLAAAGVGYLIYWYHVVVTRAPESTSAPSPRPTPAPTISMQPSRAPSLSYQPSVFSSSEPSVVQTQLPTTSSQPTTTASSAPSHGSYFCNLCGEGKTMSTENLASTVSFGSRLSKTCQELLNDQNNGYILEDQCIALFDSINSICGCVSIAGASDNALSENNT